MQIGLWMVPYGFKSVLSLKGFIKTEGTELHGSAHALSCSKSVPGEALSCWVSRSFTMDSVLSPLLMLLFSFWQSSISVTRAHKGETAGFGTRCQHGVSGTARHQVSIAPSRALFPPPTRGCSPPSTYWWKGEFETWAIYRKQLHQVTDIGIYPFEYNTDRLLHTI